MTDILVYALTILIIFLAFGLAFHRYQFQRQRQTETLLRASEERFRDLVYGTSDWIYETDECLQITYCSENAFSTLGYNRAEMLGHSPLEFLPPRDREAWQKAIQDLRAHPTPFKGVETWVTCKDGQRLCLMVSGTPILGPGGKLLGFRGISQNITERKKIEETLRQSEALNRSVLESLPHNIFAKDLEGRFTYANQHYCQTQGKPRQEIIGKTDADLHPPELAQKYRQDDLVVMENAQIIDLIEEHQPLGQEKFYVQVIKAPIRDANGQIGGVLGIFWDITEKQRMETAIRKLNRALRTISECNQTLVRATDERSLYEKICRMLVEIGGHTLAWIGEVAEGEQPTLQPIARYGLCDLPVQPIPITGVEPARGGHPSQAAVFSLSTCIIQDIHTFSAPAEWHLEVRRCGLVSMVALPLKHDEEVYGCLTIYAGQAYAFDPAEISLLEELADDLAFGIFTLRIRQARQLAQESLREGEERLRTLINAMPDIVCFKDGQGHWLEANAFDLELFQLTGVDYRGKKDSELADFSPFYREAFLTCEDTDEQAWQTGGLSRGEEVIPRPSGESHVFDIIKVPTFHPNGQRKGLIVVGRDITKRKLAEEALRQSEQRYRTLFEQANDAIFLEAEDDQIVDANRRACEMLGYEREALVNMQISDIIAPEIRRGKQVIREEIAAYGNKPFESIDIRKDGTRVPVEVTNTILSEHLTLSIVRDISERKQAEERLQQINQELSQAYDATLRGWSRALELRERETAGHSQRVVEITLKMARALGIGEDELVHVRRGVLLHDIGKMGIPDNILLKPGPLSPEEWEIMHCHPTFAYELLAGIPYLQPALDIPYCHHERWDGNGYPRGLKGEHIPLAARIFAIVDVWDALTSERPYHAAWDTEQARQYIVQQSGKHFDPQVVETFLKRWEDPDRP